MHNQQSHVHNDNGKLLLYLFNHVNIASYVPSMSDIDILTTWLLNLSITHKLNNLARFIISKFDYTVLYHELQVKWKFGFVIIILSLKGKNGFSFSSCIVNNKNKGLLKVEIEILDLYAYTIILISR